MPDTANKLHLDDQQGARKATEAAGPKARAALPKPPQGHSGYERPLEPYRPPHREGVPPRYTNKSAKQQLLDAAITAATQRGYEAMRISELTDPIGVTRQAFYAHFRDKRHCMCEAIDPRLGAIERMAASLSESDPDSAARIAHTLDDLISDRFGSAEGTRGRLLGAMIELLKEHGTLHKVRIGELVRTAHVPPADFYRQFSGKVECFAVAYERLLGELVSEVRESVAAQPPGGSAEVRRSAPECPAEHTRHDLPTLFRSLAEALNADPERRRIMIVEMAHLPDSAPPDVGGARKDALRSAITGLLADCEELGGDGAQLTFASASIVEVLRSAEVAGEWDSLDGALSELGRGPSALLMGTVSAGQPLAA